MSDTLGTVQITVTYEGKKTTFNVTVNEKAVQVENLIIKSDSSLKKDDKYVTKVSAEQTTSDVLSNFENLDAVVFDANGNQVPVIEWEVEIKKDNHNLQGTVIIDTLGEGLAYYTGKDIRISL